MKKNIKIILLVASLLLLVSVAIVYAGVTTTDDTPIKDKVSEASVLESSKLLKSLNSEPTNLKSKVKFDELQNKTIYEIENSKYFIDMDTENQLVGIHSKEISTKLEASKYKKDSASEYIMNKYKELNLPADYELNYIEKFDDLIWQANFEKNYNGIYNKYESVKVYFIPDSDEIVALGAFREAPASYDTSISLDSAKQTASSKDSSEVVASALSMEKVDDGSIRPVWVVTYSDNNIVYVDAKSNQVVGGDTIK